MAFGQQTGPPAPANRVRELLELLQDAGHSDFRDARGPMGFTQRQAGGKFTRDEVDAFIEQLENEAHEKEEPTPDEAPPKPTTPTAVRPAVVERSKVPAPTADRDLSDVSSEALAAELQQRGWIVAEP